MSGCEGNIEHGTRDYCDGCSTCHICVEEAIDNNSEYIESLQSTIAELQARVKWEADCCAVAEKLLGEKEHAEYIFSIPPPPHTEDKP